MASPATGLVFGFHRSTTQFADTMPKVRSRTLYRRSHLALTKISPVGDTRRHQGYEPGLAGLGNSLAQRAVGCIDLTQLLIRLTLSTIRTSLTFTAWSNREIFMR